MSIKEHIEILSAALMSRDQESRLTAREKELINNLVKAAAKYVDIVVQQGISIQLGEDDPSTLEHLDSRRSRAHDSLIAQINIVNRLCTKYRVSHLYKGSDDRRSQGDFALEIISEYFRERL